MSSVTVGLVDMKVKSIKNNMLTDFLSRRSNAEKNALFTNMGQKEGHSYLDILPIAVRRN